MSKKVEIKLGLYKHTNTPFYRVLDMEKKNNQSASKRVGIRAKWEGPSYAIEEGLKQAVRPTDMGGPNNSM